MRRAPAGGDPGSVDGKTITIELELRLSGDDCLTGRARNGDGSAREFAGWLGLVATIDALVHEASAQPTTTREESRR